MEVVIRLPQLMVRMVRYDTKMRDTWQAMTQLTTPYYATGDGLRSKHRLSQSDSGRAFPAWALERVPVQQAQRILDAGAGWGRFTWAMVDECHVDPTRIVCCDNSFGMLKSALQEAASRAKPLATSVSDIQALPFATNSFDGALANHVLYFAEDVPKAVRALARVLREDGWLLATTNSDCVRVPIIEFHHEALKRAGIPWEAEQPSPFSTENGAEILSKAFGEVKVWHFEDATTYTNAQAFATLYETTGRYREVMIDPAVDPQARRELSAIFKGLAEAEINRDGKLVAPILMSAFVCRGPI
jgi:ubiquinone/menaquinone biosynthesis C-methylase UbiE